MPMKFKANENMEHLGKIQNNLPRKPYCVHLSLTESSME